MNFRNLITWDYWFSQPFIAFGWVKWFWIVAFLVMILLGLVARIYRTYKKDGLTREVWRRWANLFVIMGMVGIVWMFFRQEHITFLAWRFWLLLWLAGTAWWGIDNLIYTIKRIPAIHEEKRKREEREKYLPKQK